MDMLFDIDQIDPKQLNLHKGETGIYSIRSLLEFNENPSDEVISWLINSPPIYAAKEDDEMKARMEAHAKGYISRKSESIKITVLIKKEFYDFMCTNSDAYAKERQLLNGNVNVLISGLAGAVATKLKGIEVGIITTFITFFVMLIAKMSKRVACEYLRIEFSS